jgi:hypothetical protein
MTQNGVMYVSVPALVSAIGAELAPGGVALIVPPQYSSPANPSCTDIQALPLADNFRHLAVGIPDRIDRIRASAHRRQYNDQLLNSIEQLEGAKSSIGTEADRIVSYALNHSENLIASMYYKLVLEGSPEPEGVEGELDGYMCLLESKIALTLGRLERMEGCSIFERNKPNGEPLLSSQTTTQK